MKYNFKINITCGIIFDCGTWHTRFCVILFPYFCICVHNVVFKFIDACKQKGLKKYTKARSFFLKLLWLRVYYRCYSEYIRIDVIFMEKMLWWVIISFSLVYRIVNRCRVKVWIYSAIIVGWGELQGIL